MAAAEARLVSFLRGGDGPSLAHVSGSFLALAGPLLRVVGPGAAQPGCGAPTLLLFARDAASVVTAFAAAPSGELLAVAEARAGAARVAFYSLAAAAGGLSATWLGSVGVGGVTIVLVLHL